MGGYVAGYRYLKFKKPLEPMLAISLCIGTATVTHGLMQAFLSGKGVVFMVAGFMFCFCCLCGRIALVVHLFIPLGALTVICVLPSLLARLLYIFWHHAPFRRHDGPEHQMSDEPDMYACIVYDTVITFIVPLGAPWRKSLAMDMMDEASYGRFFDQMGLFMLALYVAEFVIGCMVVAWAPKRSGVPDVELRYMLWTIVPHMLSLCILGYFFCAMRRSNAQVQTGPSAIAQVHAIGHEIRSAVP